MNTPLLIVGQAIFATLLVWWTYYLWSTTNQTLENIMSAISEFAAKQKAYNERQATAIDGLVSSVSGITDDVKALNDKITELQNSQGGVTPEDQALIDALQTQGEALATRLEGVSAAAAALDAQTPRVVPTPTP